MPDGIVDLDNSPEQNLKNLAEAKGKRITDVVACILDRPRHMDLIKAVRDTGARILLISDGDVSGVMATSQDDSGIDIYLGSGGAPEGVLAAAALRCIGGQFQGRLLFRNNDERERASRCGITDFDRKYEILTSRPATNVRRDGSSDGTMLRGVRFSATGATTQSMVMRSLSGTVRVIEATHNFDRKRPGYLEDE